MLWRAAVIVSGQGGGRYGFAPFSAQRFFFLRPTREICLHSVAVVLATARTFTLDGIAARPVRVEVDVHRGLPGFTIVGLPDAAVREARERVRAALVNCGFEFPLQRIVVNLAPASLRKAGPGMDLAIAAALLSASGQLEWEGLERAALVGELALDGSTRAVNGALAIAEAAREDGAEALALPADNGAEAALAEGIDVVPLDGLAQLRSLAAGDWEPRRPEALPLLLGPAVAGPDLADLRGQPHLRHALEVAAAGGHSLLMVGPPGAGKSLAASRVPSILPPLAAPEGLEVARIASACGRLDLALGAGRPFRAPHHTISASGLVGGGNPPHPGEVTLAHRGVLFLDELCEFRRDSLEALRGPLEAGEVAIARAGARQVLPCRFMLVAAANPCPCGRGEVDPECICAPADVQRYQGKLSGALADRIDILAAVRQPSAAEIGGPPGEPSADVRVRVLMARERQEHRLGPGRCNAEMTPAEARDCQLSSAAASLLAELYARQRLSGRAHDRSLRLAQTIADLAGAETVGEDEMAQALQLRRRDRG
jgi:magnesium chelatase family protein